MYDVVFLRDWRTPLKLREGAVTRKGCASLEEARNARFVSGDMVCYAGTFQLVPSQEWLFVWERFDATSYAHKGVVNAQQQNGPLLARPVCRD